MTEIIDKTIDEIRDQSPELGDLSDRQICYIVALGMSEVQDCSSGPAGYAQKVGATGHFFYTDFIWPDYTSSGQHAWRVLEALPARVYPQGPSIEVKPLPADLCEFYIEGPDLKYAATKAAAKCVLEGIELEVGDE